MPRHLLCVFAVLLTPAAAWAASDRLPADPRPTHMQVALDVDPARDDYSGTVRVDLEAKGTVEVIRLHARELTVSRASLRGIARGDEDLEIRKVGRDQLELVPATPLAPGKYALEMTFTNRYSRRAAALFRVETGGESYLFTQFEATEAREAFPCWDEPEFKIPWQMTLTVPEGLTAISNTPVDLEGADGPGRRRVRFRITPPMPSYLVAIAVGSFDLVPLKGTSIPTRIVCRKGTAAQAAEAAEATPPLLAALERYFGRRHPYAKLDLIAAPEFLYGAMENVGAIVFSERRLLLDPATASATDRRAMRSVVAHELAHQWFGNLVTMRWWDDLWLNESFATWMAGKVMDEVYPEYRYGQSQIEGQHRGMATDSRASTGAMRRPIESADNLSANANELTYSKGRAVLSMFESYLGEKRFRDGVLAYLKKHEWANATGDDLWTAISAASGEDVNSAMSSFLDQGGLPVVTAEWLGNGRVRLRQQRFLSTGEAPDRPVTWRIPVIVSWPEGRTLREHRVWLTEAEAEIALPAKQRPAWILPNGGALGYYVWSASSDELRAIAADRARLSPAERIGFVRNLVLLGRAGGVPVEEFVPLLLSFREDDEPEVLDAVLDALNQIREPLVPQDLEALFAGQVRRLLQPVSRRIGHDRRPGEMPAIGVVRPKLLLALGDMGQDDDVRRWADAFTERALGGAAVDGSLAEAALPLSAQRGSAALERRIREKFETAALASDRNLYLTALANFRDPAIVKDVLDYALGGRLRPQEVYSMPSDLAKFPGNRGLLQDWMEQNYGRILQRIPPHMVSRLMPILRGCEPERVERARRFFADPAHPFPGAQFVLERTADAVEDCARMARRDRARFATYLRGAAASP